MCGMASASRAMSTGAEMPDTVSRPSICGSERRSEMYATPPAITMSASITATAFTRNRRMGESYSLQDSLKSTLDRLYADFNAPDSAADPIQIVRRYARADDREVVGFCAASLAFGRVGSVLQSIERLVTVMGARPAAYVRAFDPRRDAPAFAGLVH